MDVTVIGALDGNQSLKWVCLREGLDADPRKFHSDYYLSENDVNVFQHDIKPRKSKTKRVRRHLLPEVFFSQLSCSCRWHSQILNLLTVPKKHRQQMAVMSNQVAWRDGRPQWATTHRNVCAHSITRQEFSCLAAITVWYGGFVIWLRVANCEAPCLLSPQ